MERKKTKSKSTDKYTDPALREHIKKQIQAGTKGGRAGQWSARKAQLVAQEYKKQGGGYVGGKGPAQKNLDSWTDESWSTADGKPARRGDSTTRYLPKKAWDKLSAAEKRETNARKEAGTRAGKQFVENPPAAKKARKKAKAAPRKKTAKKTTSRSKTGRKKTAKKATRHKAD